MSHIFISHSSDDIDFCRRLRSDLDQAKFQTWMDDLVIKTGMDWWDSIEKAIVDCAAFVVVMSHASRKSNFVKSETFLAQNLGRPIFPVLLDGKAFSWLLYLQYLDMRNGLNYPLPTQFIDQLSAFAPRKGNLSKAQLETVKAINDILKEIQTQGNTYQLIAAPILLQSLLERVLVDIARKNQLEVRIIAGQLITLGDLVSPLVSAHILSQDEVQFINSWKAIRNRAAHALINESDRHEIEKMAVGVLELINTHLESQY